MWGNPCLGCPTAHTRPIRRVPLLQHRSRPRYNQRVRSACSHPGRGQPWQRHASAENSIPVVHPAIVIPPPTKGSQYGSGDDSGSGRNGGGGSGGGGQGSSGEDGNSPRARLIRSALIAFLVKLSLYCAWTLGVYFVLRFVFSVFGVVGYCLGLLLRGVKGLVLRISDDGTQTEIVAPGMKPITAPLETTADAIGSMATPLQSTAGALGSLAKPLESAAETIGAVAAPIEATAGVLGAVAEPLGSVAESLQSTAGAIGAVAAPLKSTKEQLGSMAEPLKSTKTPLESTAGALGSTANALGSTAAEQADVVEAAGKAQSAGEAAAQLQGGEAKALSGRQGDGPRVSDERATHAFERRPASAADAIIVYFTLMGSLLYFVIFPGL